MNKPGASLHGQKVLVTGASGFIGRPLVAALCDLGAQVTVLGRTRHSRAGFPGTQVRFLLGDLGQAAGLAKAVQGQSVIFNLAYDFRASAGENLAGLENLLRAAEAEGRARIVHTSSIVVYDDWPAGTVTETSSMARPGGSPYRQAKIAMERRLLAGPLQAAILQPTIVYGPGSSLWTDGFAEALLSGNILLPEPEGLCQGVFVEDLVQGLLRAATLPDLGRERFILNGPAPFRWSELLQGYAQILGTGGVDFRPAAELAPAATLQDPGSDQGPSAAARVSAIARRIIGRERFEKLVRQIKRRLKPAGEMRPDAHLFALFVARGHCPATAAKGRLGYDPQFDLARGLAACADHLQRLKG